MSDSEPLNSALYGSLTAKELRRMNEQLGDSEFEMALAPYNNYTGGTPADKAKYEGLFKGSGTFNLRGQYAPPDTTDAELREGRQEYRDSHTGRKGFLDPVRDTVQGIAGGAIPKVWQHEYNHRNNPERSEHLNRNIDAIIAPDKAAWDDAVTMELDRLQRRGSTMTRKQAEKNLLTYIERLHGPSNIYGANAATKVYKEEIARGGTVPEDMQGKNWLNWLFDRSENDNLKDYADMRKKQTYWAKALRNMKASEPKK